MLAEIHIRAMVAGDLDRVVEIAAALPMAPHWPLGDYLRALEKGAIPLRVALVAEVSGSIEELVVGFAVGSLVAPEAELESIAVAAEWQGRGIGSALLGALVERVRLLGASEIMLEVRASNLAGLGLYRRAGFRETGRRRGYYSGPVEDAVLFRLVLGNEATADSL